MLTVENLGETKWYSLPFSVFAVNYFALGTFCCAAPTFALMFWLNDSNGSMFVYSLLPETLKQEGRPFVAFGCFETVFVYWSLTILTVYFVFWCALVFQNLIWLNALIK